MAKSLGAAPLSIVLRDRGYWQWSVATQLTRLPAYMTSLAFVLASAGATGTFALGGAMVTAYVVAQTGSAPLLGRWLDRQQPHRAVARLLALSSSALLGLVVGLGVHLPGVVIIVLAVAAGICTAGVAGAMRSLLSHTVAPDALSSAIAFDAVVIEIMVVVAPLLVSVVALFSPFGGVILMAIITALAALSVRRLRGRVDEPALKVAPSVLRSSSLWRSPRFFAWLVISLAFWHVIGAVETCALPLSVRLGGATFGATALIGLIAITSVSGGLIFAHFGHRLTTPRLPTALLILVVLAACGVALGFSTTWAMTIVSVLILGVGLVPLNVMRSLDVEEVAPEGRAAEAFSTVSAAHGLGYALGGLALALTPVPLAVASGTISVGLALVASLFLVRRS